MGVAIAATPMAVALARAPTVAVRLVPHMAVPLAAVRVAVTVIMAVPAVPVTVPSMAVPVLAAQDEEDEHVDQHARQRQEEHHCIFRRPLSLMWPAASGADRERLPQYNACARLEPAPMARSAD